MPVQRATMRAISSSVTRSRSRLDSFSWPRPFSPRLSSCILQLRQLAVLQFAGLGHSRRYGLPFQSPPWCFSTSARRLCTLSTAFFSFSHWAFIAVEAVAEFGHLLLQSSQALLGKLVGLLLQGRFLNLQLDDAGGSISSSSAGIESISVRDHGAGFIHQVDGLIRQETVGDIAVGQGGCCNQRSCPESSRRGTPRSALSGHAGWRWCPPPSAR